MSVNFNPSGSSVHSFHFNKPLTPGSLHDEDFLHSPSLSQTLDPTTLDPDAFLNEVEEDEEEPISQEVVKDYLMAVAEADLTQAYITKLGYVVTGTAILGLAALILKNINLNNQNTRLESQLHDCQNKPNHCPTEVIPTAIPSLEAQYAVPLISLATQKIRELFCAASSDCPQYASTINQIASQCLETPFFSSTGLPLGLQQHCIKELYVHQGNPENQSSTIHYTIKPHSLQPYNGTSSLYNAFSLTCHLDHYQNNEKNYLSTLCEGILSTGTRYHVAFNGKRSFDTENANIFHYQSNFTVNQDEQIGSLQETLSDCKGKNDTEYVDLSNKDKLYALMNKIVYRATQEI